MDIDSRIALGIYSKLVIPHDVEAKLNRILMHRRRKYVAIELDNGSCYFFQNKKCLYFYYDREDDSYIEFDLITGNVFSFY
jgi:hypothetical protein